MEEDCAAKQDGAQDKDRGIEAEGIGKISGNRQDDDFPKTLGEGFDAAEGCSTFGADMLMKKAIRNRAADIFSNNNQEEEQDSGNGDVFEADDQDGDNG